MRRLSFATKPIIKITFMDCELCKNAPVSNVSSHIIPQFFIRSMINPEGERKRGFGSSFAITSNGFLDFFFERHVDDDDVNNSLDRSLTDDEIKELSDHYAEKNWLCLNCEKRLERIENYFEEKVYSWPFIDHKESLPNKSNVYHLDSLNAKMIRLFFYSILWRMANRKFSGFQLAPGTENSLRHLLDEMLDLDQKKIITKLEQAPDNFNNFPLVVFTTRTFSNTQSNIVHVSKNPRPHFISINEYLLVFYEKRKHLCLPSVNFFGLEVGSFKRSVNENEETFKITELSGLFFDSIRTEIFKLKASDFIKELKKIFTEVSLKLLGIKKNKQLSEAYIKYFIDDDINDIEKYTYQNIFKTLALFLKGLIDKGKRD